MKSAHTSGCWPERIFIPARPPCDHETQSAPPARWFLLVKVNTGATTDAGNSAAAPDQINTRLQSLHASASRRSALVAFGRGRISSAAFTTVRPGLA
jgi:hypothetical protein